MIKRYYGSSDGERKFLTEEGTAQGVGRCLGKKMGKCFCQEKDRVIFSLLEMSDLVTRVLTNA